MKPAPLKAEGIHGRAILLEVLNTVLIATARHHRQRQQHLVLDQFPQRQAVVPHQVRLAGFQQEVDRSNGPREYGAKSAEQSQLA